MKKRFLAASVASLVAVSAMAVAASADNAGLAFQTGTYGFRNSTLQSEAIWWEDDEAADFETWKYTDANVSGDGTYTVYFEKSNDDQGGYWNFLQLKLLLSSEEYPDLTITVDSLRIDGREIEEAKGEYKLAEEGSEEGSILDIDNITADDYSDEGAETFNNGYVLNLYNTYHDPKGVISSKDDYGQRVVLTFTISGMGVEADPADTDDGSSYLAEEEAAAASTEDTTEPETEDEASTTTAAESEAATTTAGESNSSDNGDSGWIIWLIIGIVVVVVVVVIIVVASKKKK